MAVSKKVTVRVAVKKLKRVEWETFGPGPIVGVDEVGRGCLAGPVVAGAVILNLELLTGKRRKQMFFDSKTLPEDRREELFSIIQSQHQWAVGFASVLEIERLNIFHASLLAMRRAVNALRVKTEGHVLVDGKFTIPYLRGMVQTALIQGDSRAEPVSAASIVAKVTRDRWMKELAGKFPGYGFEVHKGYGTPAHRAAISKLGPCRYHRKTFSGVLPECEEDEAELSL